MKVHDEELIQRVLAGEATTAERNRLEARMVADPELQRRYDELAGAFRALGTARQVEPPHGLTDTIMSEVRRSPLPGHSGVSGAARSRGRSMAPAFPWMRLVLPGLASVVAVAALSWALLGRPWSRSGSDVAGALVAGGTSAPVSIGSGAAAVSASWEVTEKGFFVRFQGGDELAMLDCVSELPNVRLALTSADALTGSSRLSARLEPRSVLLVHGVAAGPEAAITATVSFPDGRRAVRTLRLSGLVPWEFPSPSTSAPTSDPPQGP